MLYSFNSNTDTGFFSSKVTLLVIDACVHHSDLVGGENTWRAATSLTFSQVYDWYD